LLSSGSSARFALAFACSLGALLVLVVRGSAWAESQLVSDLLQTAIAASAAVSAFLVTGRSSGYLRRLWRLFTVSLILVVGAQVIESYYETSPTRPKPMVPWPFSSNTCKKTRDPMKLDPSLNERSSAPSGPKSANRIGGF
jgi:hypothetical protein